MLNMMLNITLKNCFNGVIQKCEGLDQIFQGFDKNHTPIQKRVKKLKI